MCSRHVPFLSVAPIRGAGPPNPRKFSGGLLGPSKVNLPPFFGGMAKLHSGFFSFFKSGLQNSYRPTQCTPSGTRNSFSMPIHGSDIFPDISSDVLVLTATHESLTTSGTTQNKANSSSTSQLFISSSFFTSPGPSRHLTPPFGSYTSDTP